MVTPLVMGSHAQRLRASPSSVSRPVAGRTTRWQVDKEQHWPPTALSGRPGAPFLQGFPGTPWCEGALSSDASAHLSLPRAISCILDIWLDYHQEDFHQPPEFLFLRKLLAFMGLNMPGSDLENWAQRYLERFSYLELVELDDEDEEDWGWPSLGQGGPHRPNLHAAGPGAVGRLTPHSHGLQSGETSQGSCTHTR